MVGALPKNADGKKLTAIGRAVGAPCLFQISGRAPGIGRHGKIDRLADRIFIGLARPQDACHAAFVAGVIGDQGVQGLSTPDEPFPVFRVVAGFVQRIGAAQPGIEPVVPHTQCYIADPRQQSLVEINAAILHPQRVEPVFLSVIGPIRIIDFEYA